jgi:hypothetical protein
MPEPRRRFTGVMTEAAGLEREPYFSNLPSYFDLGGLKEEIAGKTGGWPGLSTPLYEVLVPLSLKESDFLLNVGCGLGEHTTLAGLGFPGIFPPVRHSLGVSAYAGEIESAKTLAKVAFKRPDEFRRLVDNIQSFEGNLNTILEAVASGRQKQLPPEVGFFRDLNELGDMPANVSFLETNIYHLPIPDNHANKIANYSVASYISAPWHRRTMLKELLRVATPDALVNISSLAYPGIDGRLTVAPEEFEDVALKSGVVLARRPELYTIGTGCKYDGKCDGLNGEEYPFRQMVYEVKSKPKNIPCGRIDY